MTPSVPTVDSCSNADSNARSVNELTESTLGCELLELDPVLVMPAPLPGRCHGGCSDLYTMKNCSTMGDRSQLTKLTPMNTLVEEENNNHDTNQPTPIGSTSHA